MPLEIPATVPELSPSNASVHSGGGAGELEKPKLEPRDQFSQELWDLLPHFSYLGQGTEERQEVIAPRVLSHHPWKVHPFPQSLTVSLWGSFFS